LNFFEKSLYDIRRNLNVDGLERLRMTLDWQEAEALLQRTKIKGNAQNKPVFIESFDEGLRCIGIGTDAAVFHYDKTPQFAFKMYSDLALVKMKLEERVYLQLKDAPFFPKYYGAGANFIVLSYEQGVTLYDCLIQGISVPKQVITDVEEARQYVRSLGLNPRDIHLKNVLMHEGRARVIDVSEYVKEGSDERWEHLVWAYNHFYPMIEGKQIPSWVLETVKQWYYRLDKAGFYIEEFANQAMELFVGKRK
jgi:hypothetical protein